MIPLILKLTLSVFLLLCLLHMPYGYYQAVRFIGLFGFVLLAYFSFEKSKVISAEVIIYVMLALLFQPFIKVTLGRTVWNAVDVIVSVGLVLSLFIKKEIPNKS